MKLTDNGTFQVKTQGKTSIFYVSGSTGGGTLTLGYSAPSGFVALKDNDGLDITLTPGQQYTIQHGQNFNLSLELTGATTPSIDVLIAVGD